MLKSALQRESCLAPLLMLCINVRRKEKAFLRITKVYLTQIGLMTTAICNALGARDELAQTIDAWVPATQNYEKWSGPIAAARAHGKQVWWYICCGPHHPHANFFIEYPAIEARLLMGMTAWNPVASLSTPLRVTGSKRRRG